VIVMKYNTGAEAYPARLAGYRHQGRLLSTPVTSGSGGLAIARTYTTRADTPVPSRDRGMDWFKGGYLQAHEPQNKRSSIEANKEAATMASTSGQEEFLAVICESRETVTAVVRNLAETARIDRARRRA
jgi:hypothetical protein